MHVHDPIDARAQLELLRVERDLALAIGLDADREYMADLEHQLSVWRTAWIVAAVTEIAVSRGREQGFPQG